MDSQDGARVSLPCSNQEALIGLPVIVQLHLVDTALATNPHPRQDFYRQYSITPERQTPKGERTPPPPAYSPRTLIAQEKAFAAGVAETLKQFHAGRVKFRKEEAEGLGTHQESPEYWVSVAKEWQRELWRLIVEMNKRKKLEVQGEAEEGYAQAMLLSPLQSPSPPLSNGSLLGGVQHSKRVSTTSDELQKTSPQPRAIPMPKQLQPTPDHSPDHPPTITRGQKRTRTDIEDHEEKALEQTSLNKRQRRESPISQQEQEPIPTEENIQDAGRIMSKADKVGAKGRPKRRRVQGSLAQRRIPWKLRSRKVGSYRETGAGRITGNGVWGRKEAGRKSRLAERIT